MSAKRIKAQLFTRLDKVEEFWGLPATAEAYEQIVEQMHHKIWLLHGKPSPFWGDYRDTARAALRAIGITPPARQARKGLQKGRT